MATKKTVVPEDDGRCKHCGACKECGHGGQPHYIPMPYPVYPQPYVVRPVYPSLPSLPNWRPLTWGQQPAGGLQCGSSRSNTATQAKE